MGHDKKLDITNMKKPNSSKITIQKLRTLLVETRDALCLAANWLNNAEHEEAGLTANDIPEDSLKFIMDQLDNATVIIDDPSNEILSSR